MRWRRRTILPVALALIAFSEGCGPSNGLTLGRVDGRVIVGGRPVIHGDVLFQPDESRGTSGPASIGSIRADGTFRLSTERPGDGAVVGFHKVGLTGLDPVPLARGQAGRDRVVTRGRHTFRALTPAALSNPEKSRISVEVKPGSNSFTLTVQQDGQVIVER